MTAPDVLATLRELEQQFNDPNATDEIRKTIVEQVRVYSELELHERCLVCKRGGVYIPYHKALIEGHCYSENGVKDYTRITGVCEFCFDKMHEESKNDEQ